MLSTLWRERPNDAFATRLSEASDALTRALDAAGGALTRNGSDGRERTRVIGQQALDHAQRAGRSARSLVAGHPLESVLLAGLAGAVIGWILHHAGSARRAKPAAGGKPAGHRPAQRRSRSRSGASKSP